MTTSDRGGDTGDGADNVASEVRYVAARLENDYIQSVKQLLGLRVWLPVNQAGRFLVSRRGDQRLVHAFTSWSRVTATFGPAVDPAAASSRRFAELVAAWVHPELGLVINPKSMSEFQIPRRLFDRVLQIQQQELSGAQADAVARARRRMARSADIPEAPATERMVPIEAPYEIDGFRFATVADGTDDAGRPFLAPERGKIGSPDEEQRIARYLRGGELLLLVPGHVTDIFDPRKGAVVPASSRTDGVWIWSEGLEYYLQQYGVVPEPDFSRAIRAAGYTCPHVAEDLVHAAARAMEKRARIFQEMSAAWRRRSS